MMKKLITICVISYNSSRTILETLDSVKNQTYKNIELIISDDCSKDDTVDITKKWLEDNKNKINGKIITTSVNNGTAINLRRGIENATGEWIKIIAADDMLDKQCISTFMDEVIKNPEVSFFCCDLEPFCAEGEVAQSTILALDNFFKTYYKSYEQKLKENDYKYTIMGPGYFFSKKMYDEIGGFDERFPMYEEYPFVYKAINAGYDVRPVEKKLVKYRVSNTSLSGNTKSPAAKKLLQSKKDFFNQVRKPSLLKKHMYLRVWQEIIRFKVQTIKTYSDNKLVCFMANFLYLLSPRHYIDFIRKN